MAKKKVKKTAKKAVKKAGKKPAKKAAKKSAKKGGVLSSSKGGAKKAERFTSICPYLNFNGNCEEAFDFYKGVFGGKFSYVGRFKDMPPQDGQAVPAAQANLIMHISLPISKETTLMGSDTSPEFGGTTRVGTNVSLSVNAKSKNEADRIFNGLSANGKVTMPMGNTFWGSYFGMCTDKFGINWMMSWSESGAM